VFFVCFVSLWLSFVERHRSTDMPYTVREVNPDDLQDAERLAAMFNDFDTAWPGGFTRGLPETAERLQQDMRRSRRLARFVVESDGEFVGYCDLQNWTGQTDTAYVPLLGARLSHHGRGVGKMLLREILRRATERGFRQVTLGTWAGNTKAVPLYKKTGFNWVPETDVWMRNFIPSVLTIPAGRAFFANRDWYECHEREIVIAPDDVKWKGMKVYPYRFRSGDDFLHLVFDAASEGLTALETPHYSVSCSIAAEDAPAGETYPITWEISPRGGRPLEVALLTEADPGLELRVQERLLVDRETTITRDLRVSPDARPRRGGETAHRVRSTLLIDGEPIVLETGVKVVRPLEIQYRGHGLFPGREEKVTVRLRNRLERPLEGQLALDAHPALACEQPSQAFSVPPGSWTQCEFQVTAREPGVFSTQLRYEAGQTSGSRSVAFRAFGSGGAVASIDPEDDETAVLESPGLRVVTRLRGGGLSSIEHPGTDRGLMNQPMGELGPPYLGWRPRQPLAPARVESTAAGSALVVSVPSPEFPGLTVERSVSLPGGELVRVDYRVSNTTGQPLPTNLRLQTSPWLNGHLIAPIPGGLIREPLRGWGDYPEGETDLLAHGAEFEESWVACEEDELVCGLIWTPVAAGGPKMEMDWSRFPKLTFEMGELPPHSVRCLPTVYLVAGTGNWETVRGWWRRLIQSSGTHEEQRPKPGRVLEVRTEPSPVLLTAAEEAVSLSVLNRRGRALNGRLSLGGDGFRPEPSELSLEEVNRDRPFAASVRITAPDAPAAGFVEAAVDGGPMTRPFRLPVMRLGGPGELRVTEGQNGEIVTENGWLTLRVAPGFLGSLYALEREGVNHLFSAYPQSHPFIWFNPWYGGVYPFVGWMGDPRLSKETFTGEPVERVGERGLRWRGTRVACDLEHKDRRWLRLEAEYLTTPGSNVVALVTRWTNRTDARTTADGGMAAWLQVGGTREHATSHWECEGERRHRRRGGWPADSRSGPWAAVENAATGDSLVLIATDSRAHASIDDQGKEGPHLIASGHVALEPNESREILSWLVLCPDIAQVEAYATLSQVRRLP
jgi:ribosomal protein S18 acetylase RimI-like enzyme